LRENLESNFNSLKREIERIGRLGSIYEINILIYIDMLREYIKYKVEKIDLISVKISQILRDGYNPIIITLKTYWLRVKGRNNFLKVG